MSLPDFEKSKDPDNLFAANCWAFRFNMEARRRQLGRWTLILGVLYCGLMALLFCLPWIVQ